MDNEHEAQSDAVADQILSDYVSRPEFKRLLLEIDLSLTDRGTKVLSILSLFPREGKTFVVTALAYGSAVLLGKRVLIVDCVNRHREDSLLSALLSHASISHEALGTIDVVTAQSLTGVDAKQADFRLYSALTTLMSNYDRVFIDTGAVHADTSLDIDPIIAAKQSGATVIVSSPYSLHRQSVIELRNQISTSGVPVIGTIFSGGSHA